MTTSFPRVGEDFGRYRIVDHLGHGGMGVVFRATQTDLGRDLALKVIPAHLLGEPEFRRRFESEAHVLARVDSPHITQIYDFGEHDGCLFLATQLVGGGDVGRLLRERGPMPLEMALEVTAQVARGLQDAHDVGVLHRDVKPSNILLRADERELHAYLCDFGVARRADSELTQTGGILGTYGYLAPECCLGQGASVASDVYATGCLLVALLTGVAPYAGSDLQVAQHHVSSPVPLWPGRGDDAETARVNAVVARALAKDPEQRFASARDLATALRDVRSGAAASVSRGSAPTEDLTALRPVPPTTHRLSSVAPHPAPHPGRRVAALAGAVTAFVLLGGAATALLLDDESTPSRPAAAASPTATASTSPTASPTPTAQVGCWNGSSAAPGACPLPTGQAGLRWVFPSATGDCEVSGLDRSDKNSALTCYYDVAGGTAKVTYSEYVGWPAMQRHYRTVLPDLTPRERGGMVFLPVVPGPRAPDVYRTTLYYRSPLPYAVTSQGDSAEVAAAGLDLVQLRPPGELAP